MNKEKEKRYCECGKDITERRGNAKYCRPCSRERQFASSQISSRSRVSVNIDEVHNLRLKAEKLDAIMYDLQFCPEEGVKIYSENDLDRLLNLYRNRNNVAKISEEVGNV